MWSVLLLSAAASAASLDQIEVGGLWGTPNANDATALWWNPAGMAAGSGTRLLLEGAPLHARVTHDRVQHYNNGGVSQWQLTSALPFMGIVSDANVKGLGFGAGIAVPFARGARAIGPDEDFGPGRYSMRSAQQQSVHVMGGAAWQPSKYFAFGATGQLVVSQWTSDLDVEMLTSLAESVEEARGSHSYQDRQIEDPNYATRLSFGKLRDTAATFSGGVRIMPTDKLSLSATWIHGYRVDNRGDLTLTFDCPPQSDTYGRYGTESKGLCYSQLKAHGVVGYNLPNRLHGGVQLQPVDSTTFELMGGWVGWSAYRDLDITVKDTAELNELSNPQTSEEVDQNRKWARANINSAWVGLDVKHQLSDVFLVGARYIFDRSAVPDTALHPNNYDADAHMFSGLVSVRLSSSTELGISATHHRLTPRRITTNQFNVSLDTPSADRWSYPRMNGDYTGNITRGGIQLRTRFGKERYERNLIYDRPGEKQKVQVPASPPAPEQEPVREPIKIKVTQPKPPVEATSAQSEAPQSDDGSNSTEVVAAAQKPSSITIVKRTPDTFPGRLTRVGELNPSETVLPRHQIGAAASPADFLARLWAGFGAPGTKLPNGFIYEFKDRQTGLTFQARADENGSVYLPSTDSADDPRLESMLQAFDLWLQAQEPADCEIKVRSERGAYTWGSSGGTPFVSALNEAPPMKPAE